MTTEDNGLEKAPEHPLGLGDPYLEVEDLPGGDIQVGIPTDAQWVKRGGRISKSVSPMLRYRPIDGWEEKLRDGVEKIWEGLTTDSQMDRVEQAYGTAHVMLESLEQMPDLAERNESQPLRSRAVRPMLLRRFRGTYPSGDVSRAASLITRFKLMGIKEGSVTVQVFE